MDGDMETTLRRRLRRQAGAVYNASMEVLPPSVAGRIDFSRSHLREGWGGPFNGQQARQAVVRELYRAIRFSTTVETGSFRGHSTEFMAALSGNRVLSVESNQRFLVFARRQCAAYPNVQFQLADSRSFLKARLADLEGPVFFYLDAHWYADLPLAEEVALISKSGIDAVVMVDDFQVPGDPGYTFDDFGPGKRLAAELLDDSDVAGWGWFYPSVPSREETGLRRGSIVLCSPGLVQTIEQVPGLRRHSDIA
jgi:hypothetical protein